MDVLDFRNLTDLDDATIEELRELSKFLSEYTEYINSSLRYKIRVKLYG